MRSLVLLVFAATACYRPSLDHERCVRCGASAECPGELACVAGICGGPQSCTQATDASATIDTGTDLDGAPPDGTPGRNCTISGFDGQATALNILAPMGTPATFTTDAAHTIAAFKYAPEHIGLAVPGGTSFTSIIPDGAGRNHAPKLSPEGNEIFMQTDVDRRALEFSFRVSYRSAPTTWSEPQLLSIRNGGVPIAIGMGEFPGTPTAFGAVPRRMLFLRQTTPPEWIELRESIGGSETWDQVGTYTSATFALRNFYHPQLTSDGRIVVFVGEDLTGMLAIYAALRVNPTQPFNGNAFKLREGAHGQAHPFLSDDCRRLYYNDLQNGIVVVENP